MIIVKAPILILGAVIAGALALGVGDVEEAPPLSRTGARAALEYGLARWATQYGTEAPVGEIVIHAPHRSFGGGIVMLVEMDGPVSPRTEQEHLSVEVTTDDVMRPLSAEHQQEE